jgi:uncharacterized protein YjbJ (UPF0337 family)
MTDKNTIKGEAKAFGGEVKEAVGKMTGNEKMQFEGKAEQMAGKTQAAYGKAKDAFKK